VQARQAGQAVRLTGYCGRCSSCKSSCSPLLWSVSLLARLLCRSRISLRLASIVCTPAARKHMAGRKAHEQALPHAWRAARDV
jgi:hypothetical protein